MNFIFDIGNVLIDFKPELFLRNLLNNPLDESKVNQIIFKSDEWVMLDEGVIESKEACDIFCTREPLYRELIIKAMDNLPNMLTPIAETIDLLPKIKESGHRLYYLSNYHKELSRYIQNNYMFFNFFDGGVFSCDVHMIKPSAKIYQHILDKYKLEPHECLFFDDMEENVAAAKKTGINGILFTGIESIFSYI